MIMLAMAAMMLMGRPMVVIDERDTGVREPDDLGLDPFACSQQDSPALARRLSALS